MSKDERDIIRKLFIGDICSAEQAAIDKMLTALDDADVLIAALFGYIDRIQWTAAEAANIARLKAKATL